MHGGVCIMNGRELKSLFFLEEIYLFPLVVFADIVFGGLLDQIKALIRSSVFNVIWLMDA